MLNSTDLDTITREIGEFASIFTNADGAFFTEIYNQLNALFATVPGNYAHQQKQKQDELKLLFQNANGYEANYNSKVSTSAASVSKAFQY